MTTVVIMPGGFHPFHAGHMALYNAARRTFPDAEVFVAATDDRSQRPFPFAVKEKLAKLAGVEPGHFVQVRSPFRADEITKQFDPATDKLIFVRSTKDAKEPPLAGGVLKSGKPAYLQPLLGAKRLEPFAKHAYMAYLPTVEFGPGMTSASEIRAAWPGLTDQRKTALVMSLYPAAQKNPKLAATVVKMLDAAIGSELDEGWKEKIAGAGLAGAMALGAGAAQADTYNAGPLSIGSDAGGTTMTYNMGDTTAKMHQSPSGLRTISATGPRASGVTGLDASAKRLGVDPEKVKKSIKTSENQGWAATYTSEETRAVGGQQGAGMWAGYHQRENQPVGEDYIDEKWSEKYKRSIDCSHPRGFSQRAHCQGRKK